MKVATWNVNGIRARASQLREWLERERPDVVCLQELKAQAGQIPELCKLDEYHAYWHCCKGYSGVSLHLRKELFAADPVYSHPPFDIESRIVQAEQGDLMIARCIARTLCVLALTSCGGGGDDPSGPEPPSGTIAYSTNRATGSFDSEIHVLDLRTGGDTRLTVSQGPDESPVYSPNGQRIAFSSARNGNDFRIFTMNADGSDVRQLTDDYGAWPAWSPDGSTIAFVSRPASLLTVAIHLMSSDGSNRRLLLEKANIRQSIRWSPDGQRIAFVAVSADGVPGPDPWQIYTVAVDGTELKRLSAPNDNDLFADYSPDGRSIVFSNCMTTCRLFVMNADGTGRRQLTSASLGDFMPAWSPDGRRIAFAGFSGHLFVIDADGSNLRQLTTGTGRSVQPAWRP